MNQTPNQKNEDVDANTSASSTNSTYVPPGRRNQILSGKNDRSSGPRERSELGSNNSDERFAGYRQNNQRGGFDARGPRSGSDNMTDRKSSSSFFDRASTSSAPRRSKWQDDDYGPREDRGRGRRQQVGADGLLPRDTRVEEELFENHSNTGINFDKYQVRSSTLTSAMNRATGRVFKAKICKKAPPAFFAQLFWAPLWAWPLESRTLSPSTPSARLPDTFIDWNAAARRNSEGGNRLIVH